MEAFYVSGAFAKMTAVPDNLIETPDRRASGARGMEVLDEILGSLRLTGGVVVDCRAQGDWCMISEFTAEHCAEYFPVPGTLIGYHYVRSGELWAEVQGQPPVHLRKGSVLVLPRNDKHLLYSREGMRPIDADDLLRPGSPGEPATILIEGEGAVTEIYCGFLGVSELRHPLIDSLPPMLAIHADSEHGTHWIGSSMEFLSEQSPEMVARLADAFVAHAINTYIESTGVEAHGWIAGLQDPAVARALSIIHTRYAEDLDVEMLAREAGVSRSVLGERFAELIGEPPMRYCARWRMRVAAAMLREGKQNTANIAYAVGFNSEAAFNRAFKREFGVPPATWRRRAEAEERSATANLPPQQVRYCAAKDGTRLAFSMTGEGPPLVKTANWLNHIEHDWESPIWRHWIRELMHDHCLIRYDERGNGLSDWDTPDLSFEAFVEDLETVVDNAGLEQFDLLGISQGASVAIAYAVRHPEKVRRLVLCGGYAMGWAVRNDPEESARREAMITLSASGWGADNPAYRQLFTNLYIPGASATQQQWFNEVQRVSASPENAVKLQRIFSRIDARDLLPKVTTPTIVFHSRGDKAIPFAAGEYLASHIPGAVFVPLESENHILLDGDEAWDAFVRGTREFLKGVEPGRLTIDVAEPPKRHSEEIRHCISSDGTRIAYATSGDGFPLVKAPNWITHLERDRSNPVYRHWITECSRGHTFLRSDMRGFGMSDLDPPRFTFDAMVDDLAATIEHAGFEQCDLLGAAHGAAIAMAYAARNPERVRKLILLNSFAAGWRVRADPEEIAWRTSLMELNQREWAFRRSMLGEMFLTLYFPTAGQDLIDWHNANFEELGPVEKLEAMIELAADIDVRDELQNIRAPTLICHSNKDANAPLKAGRAVADAIHGSTFIELDSANHILLGTEPAWRVFRRHMRAFLAADLPPAEQPAPMVTEAR